MGKLLFHLTDQRQNQSYGIFSFVPLLYSHPQGGHWRPWEIGHPGASRPPGRPPHWFPPFPLRSGGGLGGGKPQDGKFPRASSGPPVGENTRGGQTRKSHMTGSVFDLSNEIIIFPQIHVVRIHNIKAQAPFQKMACQIISTRKQSNQIIIICAIVAQCVK